MQYIEYNKRVAIEIIEKSRLLVNARFDNWLLNSSSKNWKIMPLSFSLSSESFFVSMQNFVAESFYLLPLDEENNLFSDEILLVKFDKNDSVEDFNQLWSLKYKNWSIPIYSFPPNFLILIEENEELFFLEDYGSNSLYLIYSCDIADTKIINDFKFLSQSKKFYIEEFGNKIDSRFVLKDI